MKSILMIFGAAGLLTFLAVHILWYIKPSKIESMEQLNTHLHGGQPTVIEFYSNL